MNAVRCAWRAHNAAIATKARGGKSCNLVEIPPLSSSWRAENGIFFSSRRGFHPNCDENPHAELGGSARVGIVNVFPAATLQFGRDDSYFRHDVFDRSYGFYDIHRGACAISIVHVSPTFEFCRDATALIDVNHSGYEIQSGCESFIDKDHAGMHLAFGFILCGRRGYSGKQACSGVLPSIRRAG